MQMSYQTFQWLCVFGNFVIAAFLCKLTMFLIRYQWAQQKNYIMIHGAKLNRVQQWIHKLPAEVKPL
jgi:hypothetical protein